MRRVTAVPAPLLVIAAVVSVQFGGALAATLVPLIGAAGSVTLRLIIAAVVMLLIARPSVRGHSRTDWAVVVGFALTLALMNLSFYAALARLPIGVTVTIEFIGPLTLAAVLSKRARDLASVAGAGVGVVLISGVLTTPWSDLDLVGLGLALAAGGCWACYVLLSGRTGARFAQLDGLAIAMLIAALVVAPFGILEAGSALWSWDSLSRGVGIAVLSSVLPYSLELMALRRLAAHVFGVLLSLEPAVAALAGLLVLGQHLTGIQLAGMAFVVVASALVMGRREPRPATASQATDSGQ